ncbi:hypothetical protein ACFXPT_39140 [Streptomyces goshikiensis]|uniref:hypothetical protein n=1 Tax=Streptomyces goshikiensis TaxID=1942 RepID=UPI0036BB94E2
MAETIAPYVINDGNNNTEFLPPWECLALYRNTNRNASYDAPVLIVPNGAAVASLAAYGFGSDDTGASSLYTKHTTNYRCVLLGPNNTELIPPTSNYGYPDLSQEQRPGGTWDNDIVGVRWDWIGTADDDDPLQPGELRREFEELNTSISALRKRSDRLEQHLAAIQRQLEGSTAEQRAANAKIRALLAKLADKCHTRPGN